MDTLQFGWAEAAEHRANKAECRTRARAGPAEETPRELERWRGGYFAQKDSWAEGMRQGRKSLVGYVCINKLSSRHATTDSAVSDKPVIWLVIIII